MARYIDADALIADVTERCCKDCNKRKGMKNGKLRTIYEIGEVPCRACDIDYMKDELDNVPTVDAVPVVRCGECRHKYLEHDVWMCRFGLLIPSPDGFCSYGEKVTE